MESIIRDDEDSAAVSRPPRFRASRSLLSSTSPSPSLLPYKMPVDPPLTFDRLPEYDYVVVGGGTAGELSACAASSQRRSPVTDPSLFLQAACWLIGFRPIPTSLSLLSKEDLRTTTSLKCWTWPAGFRCSEGSTTTSTLLQSNPVATRTSCTRGPRCSVSSLP